MSIENSPREGSLLAKEIAEMPIRTAWITAVAMGGSLLAAGTAFAKMSPVAVSRAQDAKITRELRRELSVQMPGSRYRIHVSTKNGVVTLSGLAESGETELQALHDAQGIAGVRRVKNELNVVS